MSNYRMQIKFEQMQDIEGNWHARATADTVHKLRANLGKRKFYNQLHREFKRIFGYSATWIFASGVGACVDYIEGVDIVTNF